PCIESGWRPPRPISNWPRVASPGSGGSDRPGYQPGPRSRVTCQNAARTVRSAGGRRVGCAGRGSELACPRSCVGEAGSLTAPWRDEVRVSAPPHGPAIWAVRTLESGGVTSSARMRPSRLRLSGQPAPAERVSPNNVMKRVQDKVAVVTGGARGLGLAAAERLCEEGARVLITDLNGEEGREQQARLAGLGYSVAFEEQDVIQPEGWPRVLDAAIARWGRLDVLVNNAGIAIISDVEALS